MWSIYTMGYSSASRKDEHLSFASMWMELEGIMLSEVSQSEKDCLSFKQKDCLSLYGLIHSGNIKNSERELRGKERK